MQIVSKSTSAQVYGQAGNFQRIETGVQDIRLIRMFQSHDLHSTVRQFRLFAQGYKAC